MFYLNEEDPITQLIQCDWLEENNDPYAELLRKKLENKVSGRIIIIPIFNDSLGLREYHDYDIVQIDSFRYGAMTLTTSGNIEFYRLNKYDLFKCRDNKFKQICCYDNDYFFALDEKGRVFRITNNKVGSLFYRNIKKIHAGSFGFCSLSNANTVRNYGWAGVFSLSRKIKKKDFVDVFCGYGCVFILDKFGNVSVDVMRGRHYFENFINEIVQCCGTMTDNFFLTKNGEIFVCDNSFKLQKMDIPEKIIKLTGKFYTCFGLTNKNKVIVINNNSDSRVICDFCLNEIKKYDNIIDISCGADYLYLIQRESS